jgi:hypothetical protein
VRFISVRVEKCRQDPQQTNPDQIISPPLAYAAKLLFQELASMNIAYAVCSLRCLHNLLLTRSYDRSSVHDCTRTEPQPGERTRNAALAKISLPRALGHLVSSRRCCFSAFACCIEEHLSLYSISAESHELANPKRYTISRDTKW